MLLSNTSGMIVHSVEEVAINKSITAAVTGHRETSIAPYLDKEEYRAATVAAVRMFLDRYIDIVMGAGYNCFLSGLAQGTDLWAAKHVLERKRWGENSLIGVMPFLRHADRLGEKDRVLLCEVERYAELVAATNDDPNIVYQRYPSSGAAAKLYSERNHFLVDNSSALIAFLDNKKVISGTGQTVRYARQCGEKVYCFSLDDVYDVIERVGTDKWDMYAEIAKVNFHVDPPKITDSQFDKLRRFSTLSTKRGMLKC